MSPDVEKKKNEFLNSINAPAFSCIGSDYKKKMEFIKALEVRYNAPEKINQGDSSLCAAAAFMYCIARKKPDEYANYVLDLAMTGKARLGNMIVKPENAPNGYHTTTKDEKNTTENKTRSIDPVDWVALASVRDGGSGVDSDWGGLTVGSTLTGWFRDTDWFSDVQNATQRLHLISGTMNDLLRINELSHIIAFACSSRAESSGLL